MNFKIALLISLSAATCLPSVSYAQVGDPDIERLARRSDNDYVREFYQANNYQFAWTDEENVGQLLTAIRNIGDDGLNPDYYQLNVLDKLASEIPRDSARLDVALSQAFLEVAHDFYQGRLIPEKLFPQDWDACTQPADYTGLLHDALRQMLVCETLDFLRPMDAEYEALRNMLVRLRGINSRDSIPTCAMAAGTKHYEDSVETIIANLERYRWHQSRLIERSIVINIPSEELTLSDHESAVIKMKVIIGRVDRRTPVVSSRITLLTINPTWTVPPTVFKEDIFPSLESDRGYLARHNMKVINHNGDEINVDSINWSTVDATHFPYYLREDAGPLNPLGRIKFSFPNDHSVYLHDTNMPSLFSKEDRTLSSGCIRIEHPMELAKLLIEGSGWTEAMIQEAITKGETKLVLLKKTMPVHITYFTALVSHGELVLLRDVYQYDRVVLNALRAGQSGL
jgi:murein L,D-transpeptidase YcbB/YkuD